MFPTACQVSVAPWFVHAAELLRPYALLAARASNCRLAPKLLHAAPLLQLHLPLVLNMRGDICQLEYVRAALHLCAAGGRG